MTVAEDPVRQAARDLDDMYADEDNLVVADIGPLREALAKPAPPSLTEGERKAVASLLDRATIREWNCVGKDLLESAREKLS